MRLLLVEDTQDFAEALCKHLISGGHTIDYASTLNQATHFWRLNKQYYDLIILDIELPDGEGTSLLKQVRGTELAVGVLVLTARSEIDDKVHLLDIGADDYLTKPFSLKEFDARLRAVHRRHLPKTINSRSIGPLEYDPLHRTLWSGKNQIMLRAQEMKLVEALIEAPSHLMEKSRLFNRMYGLDQEASENAVEVHVSRLRKRLEPYQIRIKTVRGHGYQLVWSNNDE